MAVWIIELFENPIGLMDGQIAEKVKLGPIVNTRLDVFSVRRALFPHGVENVTVVNESIETIPIVFISMQIALPEVV